MAKGTLFVRTLDGHLCVSDFANVYNASLLARRCLSEKLEIYSITVQQASLSKILDSAKTELPFTCSTRHIFFVLVMPLSMFPSIHGAWTAWVLTGIVFSGWSVLA